MNQRWLAKRGSQPARPRVRDRKNNVRPRRPGGNRCGHDPKHFLRPEIRRGLPGYLPWAIEGFESYERRHRQLDFDFQGFSSRSERDEAVGAMVLVMLASTCVPTQRIGRPSKKEPGTFEGLTVDHHLAPMSGVSESRIERAIGTIKDRGWQYFETDKKGRRCAAQPIEENETGEPRGLAAIRKWTPEFWRDIGISERALKEAIARYLANLDRTPDHVPVAPLLSRLAEDLSLPRERPPP